MKKIIKNIVFGITESIVRFSEQVREERKRVKFNIHPSSSVYGVGLDGNIKVGVNTYINERSRIDTGSKAEIQIGNHCAIGRNVHITAKTHDLRRPTTDDENDSHLHIEESIVIGNYVWVGDNSVILPGVTVWDYAVIGANSVVTKDVGKFEIVAGNPAKHIRFNTDHYRFKI